QHEFHCLLHLRAMNIETPGERHRQVVRPEADHIDAVEREDLIELVKRAFSLDLGAGDGPVIGGSEILALLVEPRPVRPPAAQAPWRVLHRLHEGFGVLDGFYHRAHDPLRASVERAADQAKVVLSNAHDCRQARGPRRSEAGKQSLVAAEPVLLIDGDTVEGRLPDKLDEEGVVEGEPGVEQGAALLCRFAEAILGHVETAQLFASDSIWPTATPIRSTILLRIWWSDFWTPLASKSRLILRKTSSPPGISRSALLTSRA